MYTKIVLVMLMVAPSLQKLPNSDPIDELKSDILNEQTLQNVGGMINNFMHSDGAKQLGDILTNAANGNNAGEILQGIGSVIGQGKGLDPSMLGMVMNMMQSDDKDGDNDSGLDMNVLANLFGSFLGQNSQGNAQNFWDYVPMILQTLNSFLGPEANERARHHTDHANLVPPIIEKLHLWFDHFVNSEMGKRTINTIGAEKFVKVFADESGRWSYRRFVDLLENHSFRKHWIRMVTNKLASTISHFTDSGTQQKYLTTIQHFLNSILKSQRYPKSTLIDFNRPVETISALINHVAKDQLNIKVDSKEYVKPIVDYITELFRLAEGRGMLDVNSHELSDKLADTINLEVIEPIARVNRAYRFATKVPLCDRYVMCLVNQESEDKTSLPGLKPMLSKSTSLIFSWFLSSSTKTPYWDLYRAIVVDGPCHQFYMEACHDFHLEEIKVKEEYVHNEL